MKSRNCVTRNKSVAHKLDIILLIKKLNLIMSERPNVINIREITSFEYFRHSKTRCSLCWNVGTAHERYKRNTHARESSQVPRAEPVDSSCSIAVRSPETRQAIFVENRVSGFGFFSKEAVKRVVEYTSG